MKKTGLKAKSIVLFLLILSVIAGALGIAYVGVGENNTLGMESIKLGLDLQGGVNIVYEAQIDNPTMEDMSAAQQMIQLRLDKENYTEAEVSIEGSDRLRVDIPGVEDPQQAINSIGAAAMLKFWDQEGNEVLTGKNIESASFQMVQNQMGVSEAVVQVKMDAEGTKLFRDFTKANKDKLVIITLDDQIISQATIRDEIPDGVGMISGGFTADSAKQLAERIEAGSLPFALKAISSSGVGAKLGMDALNTSILAGAIGFAFIMVFMIVLYRVSGVAADLALLLYVGLVIMILSTMGATLTLPGIAGIILSIGMAVDANVIIFTRIKEEITAGRSVRSAVDAGFSKAFSAILDGNVTTLIAAAVLWTMGTGLIKSFAQTLAVGIVVSMFTALVVTRTILKLFIGMGLTKASVFASVKAPKEKTLAIIANRKKYYFLSAAIIIIGLAAMPFFGMQGKEILNYDVEFKGGSVIQVDLKQEVNPETDIMPLIDEHIPDSGARIQKVAGTNEIIITMKAVEEEGRAALTKAINEKYNLTEADLLKDDFVSATISDEFKLKAIGAVALGAVFMLIYITIRFKDFKFGASAVIALLHNVMIMLGVYALFRIPINNSFIAAMLTIVGYSINDTIIIFDRIRENRGRMQGDDEEIINTSIKQTLTRSINTSITTIVMVVLLFVIGTDAVKEFAFPLVIGIVAGTYSSIFIASPLWYQMRKYMREHKPQAKKKSQPKKA